MEQHTGEDGRPALQLTARGAQVGHALAVGGEEAGEMPDAVLLDEPS